MIEAVLDGLLMVVHWPAIGFLGLGTLIGMWLGAVPGLGGIIGLVLALPFTISMDPVPSFALLIGLLCVTSTSDTIASVMLGIPGTGASQATILDGYPMAQKGEAKRAFGAAFFVSAFGGVFGSVVLAISLPILLPLILLFASPEIFMLGALGLAMVSSLSGGGSLPKALLAAALGLFLSTVGYGDTVCIPRFWFGSDYLVDGLPIIPVVMGLFALPELMDLAVKNISISQVPRDQSQGTILDGVKDALKHWWLTIRCSAIGTYIGLLPGLGAIIVDWLAYGYAVRTAKDKSGFGRGDIRGVIAPEAANNATRPGALIPTVAFGIPGSLPAAILLEVFLEKGLQPGAAMLTRDINITFSLIWMIVLANIAAAAVLMIWSRQVAKVAFLPGHLIIPGVIPFVFMGAWLAEASMGDWIAVVSVGILGYLMKRGGWPRPPLVLALILGPILENNLLISIDAYGSVGWLGRPLVLIIGALALITLYKGVRDVMRVKRDPNVSSAGEGGERNPLISLPLSLGFVLLFAMATIVAMDWAPRLRNFPLFATIPGFMLALITLKGDLTGLYTARRAVSRFGEIIGKGLERGYMQEGARIFMYLILVVALTPVIGQKLALTLFALVYLRRWGGFSWLVAACYAIGVWAVLIGFYDRVLHTFWQPSYLADILRFVGPEWLPQWLLV